MSDEKRITTWSKNLPIQNSKTGPQWAPGTNVRSKGDNIEVDVDFVIDTTGSMSNKIEALLQTCVQFVSEGKKKNLSIAFTVIAFGDVSAAGKGDRIDVVISSSTDIEKVKQALIHIPRNDGYGNDGESAFEAIQTAIQCKHRPGAIKVMLLITDEPALQYKITHKMIAEQVKKHQYIMFVLGTRHHYYKELAQNNGGEWQEISVTSDLSSLLRMFDQFAQKVAQTAQQVNQLAGGDVGLYLQLNSGKK